VHELWIVSDRQNAVMGQTAQRRHARKNCSGAEVT
jgi:hypothetical protein